MPLIFYKNSPLSSFSIPEAKWVPVTGMMFMGPNVFFTLAGAKPRRRSRVSYVQELLKSSYYKELHGALEEYQGESSIVLPTEKRPSAIGTGTTRKDEAGNAVSEIKFRIKGKIKDKIFQ